jgi:predicted amidophosphoribosyltransferase
MPRECPQCKQENPNTAKYCMNCNTQLVPNEELSEEDKMQRKLDVIIN